MKKNRIEYCVLIFVLLALFVWFEKTMFLWAILGLIVLCILARILIQMDKDKVSVKTKVVFNDKKPYLEVHIEKKSRLICTNQLFMRFMFKHTLFDISQEKEILLTLSKDTDIYRIDIDDTYCGQVIMECKTCALLDVFCLFSMPVQYQKRNSAIVYPNKVHVQLGMANNGQGMVDFDGMAQNQKGHDLSEIFDIRKYEPGDDVRSIHWKLSQKIGDLVIREASNLSQYSILVIPDFALEALDIEEMNTAVSVFIALSEELLESRVGFCVPLVSEKEIELRDINNLNQFHETLDSLLSLKAMPSHGELIRYLFLNHFDGAFTRLIVVGNGRFKNDFYHADTERSFSLIHACKDVNQYYYTESQKYFDAYVPVHQKGNEKYSLYF